MKKLYLLTLATLLGLNLQSFTMNNDERQFKLEQEEKSQAEAQMLQESLDESEYQRELENAISTFWKAITLGDTTTVDACLKNYPDLKDMAINDGVTPLHIAAQNGHKDTVIILIAAGANIEAALTSNGATPLYTATQNNHIDIVAALFAAGANVDAALTTNGATPLYMAVQNGDISVVKLLIELGANVDAALATNGTTPLFIAAQNDNLSIVELLIEAKANVHTTDTRGRTPLYIATQNDNSDTDTVMALIKAGADINTTDICGRTHLFMAAQNGNINMVNTLIDLNANVDQATTSEGVTPLCTAAIKGKLSVVEALIKRGKADINKTTKADKFTPLYMAVKYNNTNIFNTLIDLGADVNIADINGATPLSIAIKNGNTYMFRTLIEAGADVDETNTFSSNASEMQTILKSFLQEKQLKIKEALSDNVLPDLLQIINYYSKVGDVPKYTKSAIQEQQLSQERKLNLETQKETQGSASSSSSSSANATLIDSRGRTIIQPNR